jgi:hypothetical protein
MATDLYVGGWDNPSQQAVFGKIDSETGAYTQINSGLGLNLDSFSGLAWDPSINAFHTRSIEGWFNTITKTGTTGHPSKTNHRGGHLAYHPLRQGLYYFAEINDKVDSLSINGQVLPNNSNTAEFFKMAESYIRFLPDNFPQGISFFQVSPQILEILQSVAFLEKRLCCIYEERIPNQEVEMTIDPRLSDHYAIRYGFFDLKKRTIQPISPPDRKYQGMRLAYDGSTLFGLKDYTLYTLNPETGAYTQVAKVTGISEGNTMLECMSAIPMIAS